MKAHPLRDAGQLHVSSVATNALFPPAVFASSWTNSAIRVKLARKLAPVHGVMSAAMRFTPFTRYGAMSYSS